MIANLVVVISRTCLRAVACALSMRWCLRLVTPSQSQKLRLLPTNGQGPKLPYRRSGSFHVIGMEFLIGRGVGFSDSVSISTNGERDLHSDTD